jgi:hypothetical protein
MGMQRAAVIPAIFGLSAWTMPPSAVLAGDGAAPSAPALIPFASRNIFTWEADGEKGIWVQSIGRRWYYAEFMSPCTGIQFRTGVRYKFGPAGKLDRWGAVIVPHVSECFFKSFSVSAGPQANKPSTPAAAPPRSGRANFSLPDPTSDPLDNAAAVQAATASARYSLLIFIAAFLLSIVCDRMIT